MPLSLSLLPPSFLIPKTGLLCPGQNPLCRPSPPVAPFRTSLCNPPTQQQGIFAKLVLGCSVPPPVCSPLGTFCNMFSLFSKTF